MQEWSCCWRRFGFKGSGVSKGVVKSSTEGVLKKGKNNRAAGGIQRQHSTSPGKTPFRATLKHQLISSFVCISEAAT